MEKLNTKQAVTQIELAFSNAKIRPLCSIKNLLVENARFQNNPRNKRRYYPLLPTFTEGNHRYYLDQDVQDFTLKLIDIMSAVVK